MTAPPIIDGFPPVALIPLFLAGLTAWMFWAKVVPRQLRGLQVAFETGELSYEVHQVTHTVADARELLRAPGMKFGVITYLFALVGALILLFEFLLAQFDISSGYHAPSLAIALMFIALPALVSSASSLGTQVFKPIRQDRASLQVASLSRTYNYVYLLMFWMALVWGLYIALAHVGVYGSRRFSIAALALFSPSALAYGRILGSSWQALRQSSKKTAKGEISPFHNHAPNARQQVLAQFVNFNLIIMPFVAVNTFVSLLVLLVDPNLFVHSDRVLSLPEYRLQETFMEEGGLLGFGLIELFSYIPVEGIRVPIVSMVLLFLLLNVAIIGFLFVSEVAHILFLNVQDASGRGGIKLADSRLLSAERSQQAKVLNFCFTGFAGQSMLLLALAMITFWDSSFLPQTTQCGTWEATVCSVLTKEGLEELTWMLASGGQIAFLAIWVRSLRVGSKIEDITFDAAVGNERQQFTEMEDIIYLKKEPLTTLVAQDEWVKALKQLDTILQGHGKDLDAVSLGRKTAAIMTLYAGFGRWNDAEDNAISLIAYQSGKKAELARLILSAASLAQRDFAEAKPRLPLLPEDNIEAVRIKWAASLFSTKLKSLDERYIPQLSMDSIMRRNIDLVKRFQTGTSRSDLKYVDSPAGRLFLLGDLARMRLARESEDALDLLERFIKTNEIELWVHGEVVRCLLHLDAGRVNTAVATAEKLLAEHGRHPHLRALFGHLSRMGLTPVCPSELTELEWITESEQSIDEFWSKVHVVSPPPAFHKKGLKQHAWRANAWYLHGDSNQLTIASKKGQNGWKMLSKVDLSTFPVCLNLHLTGIIVTVGGMPVDLGFPGGMDFQAIKARGLIDL
tara:strand:- start:4547 stop:7099 length:2553 start_codon:yes stop_codon:yes gene_type:complete